MNLSSELKRRNVFKVAIAYLMVSWLILQLVTMLSPLLFLPEWISRAVLLLLIIISPIMLLLTWAFELTPVGMKRTADVDENQSIRYSTGQKINYIIIGLLALAVVFLLYDRGAEHA